MSYIGYSVKTKADLDAEVSRATQAEADEAQVRSQADTLLQSNLDAEQARAEVAEQTLTSNLAQEVSDRQTAISAEQTARATAVSGLDGRLAPLESWKADHETAIHDAVDQAIADNTTLIGQVETSLNDADSALSTRISQHIVDRVASDEDHIAKLAVSSANDVSIQQALQSMMTYLDAFSRTYSVYDAQQTEVVLDVAGINSLVSTISAHEANAVVNSEAVVAGADYGALLLQSGRYYFADHDTGVSPNRDQSFYFEVAGGAVTGVSNFLSLTWTFNTSNNVVTLESGANTIVMDFNTSVFTADGPDVQQWMGQPLQIVTTQPEL